MLEKFFITCNVENHWTLTDATQADDKIIFLHDEYDKFWRKILRGENFALARFADGELGLILGNKMQGIDGWSTSGGGVTALGKALRDSLTIDAPNFFYGISCPCCDSAAYYWYLRNLKTANVTFSNIWLNANYAVFQKNFSQLERDAVLITNWRGKGKTYGRLNVKRHYFVSDDCIKFYEDECDDLIRRIIAETGHEKNLLYVVSAGPISEVIIAALFKNNPDNCYIDFGSATDLITHERITRPYMIDSTPYAKQNCWMFDGKKISVDVDVVLTCYKRPQVLAQQLEAIKNQTLPPKRIFLYQDGINGYYSINLNEKILGEFDACKISATNGGVWKRFEFAEEITKSPYVCLFDDDTIPGARWLENCHITLTQNPGICVTNGVLLIDAESYPKMGIRIGWHTPNAKTCAVDFGGHSWFMNRECLNWLLDKPWRTKYKLVGEDMTLSFAASEHDLGTYVPQHPAQILSLWGSLPKFGLKYGTDENAISVNPSNMNTMKAALKEIYSHGWKLLLEENPDYLEEISSVLASKSMTVTHHQSLLRMLKDGLNNLLPSFGKRLPIFLGEQKYSLPVSKIFDLSAEDYHVLENNRNEIELSRLVELLRQGAINIFFTDSYEELKPFLDEWGLRENVDYIDGRSLVIVNSD